MDYIFCGIKFPSPRSYERIRLENVNFNENSSSLKERVRSELLSTKDEITLVYCGNILEDDEPINKYNLHAGSTVHVLKKIKNDESAKEYSKFTELDVARICAMYKGLNSGSFNKISKPEVINAVLKKHPELQKDIVALSFMKDPILLANLQNPDTVRKLAENHRVLIEASETICKTLKSVKSAPATEQQPSSVAIPSRQQNFDDLSDESSSSSSGSEANSPQASTSSVARRITSDFLRRSLAAAVQQNQNSLASISQRNLTQSGSNPISPSSSTSSVPQRRNIISNSMVMDAMNEVLRARRSEADVFGRDEATAATAMNMPVHSSSSSSLVERERQSQESEVSERMEEDEDARDAREIEMIASFQMQLKQMEDMGLMNKATNIQALMVCNGNLEAAVNLVLTEMNMS